MSAMPDSSPVQRPQPGRGDRIAGLLCYVFGPLLLLIRRSCPGVRFHAIQATFLALVVGIVNLAIWVIIASIFRYSWDAGVRAEPFVSYLYMAELVLWMVMLYFGYELAVIEIPTIGGIAKRLAGES